MSPPWPRPSSSPHPAPRLFLIDGYSNIFRAFYAIRNLSNSRGEPTNAVYGFVTMLRKLLREENPDLIGVALDVGKTFRNEKFEDYKANRRPMPEDLAEPAPAGSAGCWRPTASPSWSSPATRRTTCSGTLSCRAAEAGYEVVLVSADKDLMQLVEPRVSLYHTGRNKLYGPQDVDGGLRRAAGEGGRRPRPDGRLDRQHPRRAGDRREGGQVA